MNRDRLGKIDPSSLIFLDSAALKFKDYSDTRGIRQGDPSESGVRVTHLPTGFQAEFIDHRPQHPNRIEACATSLLDTLRPANRTKQQPIDIIGIMSIV